MTRLRSDQPFQGLVYRHFDDTQELLYIGTSDEWRIGGREMSHKHTSRWWDFVDRVTYETFPDRRTARDAELKAIYAERPVFNRNVKYKAEQIEAELRYLTETGWGGIPLKYCVAVS